MARPVELRTFLDHAADALDQCVDDPRARRSVAAIFDALGVATDCARTKGARLPLCDHLAEITRPDLYQDPLLRNLIGAFARLEPRLVWRRRSGGMSHASANFADNHANTVIVGPGGFEPRSDVIIGASLVAPGVRYPDHDHPPEETYLVLSDGWFRQGDGDWFEPGMGGTLYNPPGIRHAMKTGENPLFAFWFLREQ